MTVNDLGGGELEKIDTKNFKGPSPGKKISTAILQEKKKNKNVHHG